MFGHRSIYHDGWRAVCPWPGASFIESGREFGDVITYDMLTELDAHGWELYYVAEDVAETNNLAGQEHARLIEMIGMWYAEAGKYNVFPIDSRGTARIAEERPSIALERNRYVLYPNTQAVPAGAAPKILNRPYSFNAEVVIPEGGAEGALLSMGGNDGGVCFYVQEGKLCYVHNYVAKERYYVKSDEKVPEGHHFLTVEFEPTGPADIDNGKGVPGKVTLLVDGQEIGRGEFPVTSPLRLGQGAQMLVGADAGAPVSPESDPPFAFTGEIKRIVVDVSGESVVDHRLAMRVALRKQ